MPIILAMWEGEIGKITVQGQPRQKVQETPSQPIAVVTGRYHKAQLFSTDMKILC
jgi:hypothetical protein